MTGASLMLLLFFGTLLLLFCFAFLVGNRPGPERQGAPPDEAASGRLERRRRYVKLAFWYCAAALAAHRIALAWLYSTMDFTDSNTQAGFGMTWFFLDPLAGLPIILGTAPFAAEVPMTKFMGRIYQPLSFLLYGGYIYGLWLLARHAFRPAPAAGEGAGTR